MRTFLLLFVSAVSALGQTIYAPSGYVNAELAKRPVKAAGYAVSKTAVIDSTGKLTAAPGAGTNCVLVNGTSAACGAGGGITSIGLTMPVEFTVSGSPLTENGTLAVTKANQAANLVYAGPGSGGAAAPGFRSLVELDIPTLAQSKITNLVTDLGNKQPLSAVLTALAALSPTDDSVTVGNGTTWQSKILPDCDNATTSKLLYDNTTNAFSCGTDQTGGGGFDATALTNLTWSDGLSASIVWTYNVSGTDHSVTFGNNLVNFSGAIQQGGVPALIAGSSTVGQIPRITGASTYAWGALDLADTDAVTGLLPDGNIAASIARDSEVSAAYQPLDADLTAIAGLTRADDYVIVGGASAWERKVLPDCSNATTSKMLYNISTNEFSCGTDQTSVTMYSQLGDLAVVRNSASSLTLGTSCSLSTPCNVRYGNTVYTFTDAPTATSPTGTGTVWFSVNLATGARTASYSNTGLTCGSGLTCASGGTGYPAGHEPLYSWTVSADAFDASGGADVRSPLSREVPYTAGACLTLTNNEFAAASISTSCVTNPIKTRTLTFVLGADNGPALADADDQPTIWANRLGSGITITEVWCESDAGTPSINLQRDDGTPANILSSNLSCSTSGATGTIDTAEDNVSNGNKIDFVMVTAGGTAKRATVTVTYTLD